MNLTFASSCSPGCSTERVWILWERSAKHRYSQCPRRSRELKFESVRSRLDRLWSIYPQLEFLRLSWIIAKPRPTRGQMERLIERKVASKQCEISGVARTLGVYGQRTFLGPRYHWPLWISGSHGLAWEENSKEGIEATHWLLYKVSARPLSRL